MEGFGNAVNYINGSLMGTGYFAQIALRGDIAQPKAAVMASAGRPRDGIELRKKPRRQFRYRAKILTSEKGTPRYCSISDISEIGARIVLARDEELPPRFLLLLSSQGGARRVCRLVWRKGLTVGVEFPESQS
jgi:hypothetical protein